MPVISCCGGGRTDKKSQIMNDKMGKKSQASSSQQLVKEAVSSKLRAYYDDIARQDVPQRFLDLLHDLDKAGGNEAGGKKPDGKAE